MAEAKLSVDGRPRRRTRSQWQEDLDTHLGDTGPSMASAMASRTPSPNPAAGSMATITEQSPARGRPRRNSRRSWKRYVARRPWTIPLAILIVLGAIYAVNPGPSNPVHQFIFLSYELEGQTYGKGRADLAFVAFYTVVLFFIREFLVQQVLLPFGHFCGIQSRGKRLRFTEQMYTALYILFMGPFGLHVMRTSTPEVWYFQTRGMYEGYPHRLQTGQAKAYYLVQAAFWAQQSLVMMLGLEKRRKDFHELLGHHIVTLSLIGLSYQFHFTYMGIAVYVTHDISDLLLALCKSLVYVNSNSRALAPLFVTMVSTWIYTRHYLNLRILASLLTEFRTVGPYELDWEKEQYKCAISNVITFTLLALLQALNIFWLGCLIRSAYRLAVLKVAKDDRSDDEDEGEKK